MYEIPDDVYHARYVQLCDMLELDEFADRPVRTLSLGQRMRGELAAAVLHRPPVLILDEPTIGMDAASYTHLDVYKRQQYARVMKHKLELCPNLEMKQAEVVDLQRTADHWILTTQLGAQYACKAVILATGTFLSLIHILSPTVAFVTGSLRDFSSICWIA